MNDVRVPAGWTYESVSNTNDYFLIKTPEGYMATLDFARRVFRSGMTISACPVNTVKKYRGRGWKQALCDDATKWLEALRRS